MTSRDFCFWLQGFLEVREPKEGPITPTQATLIQKHLNLVFIHEVDPSFGDAEAQAKLNEEHTKKPPTQAAHKPFDMNTPFRC